MYVYDIYLIEKTLTHENGERCDPNFYWELEKKVVICDSMSMRRRQVAWLNFQAFKEKNILIINKWNIAEHTDAIYPESYSVSSLKVYAFQRYNVLSIACTYCSSL